MSRYFNPKRRDNFFDKVLMEVPSTNTFDQSHSHHTTMNMGQLTPVYLKEVYPGDKVRLTQEHLIKLAPMATPVQHICKIDLHAFYVPSRLLWDGFEEFQAYNTLNDIPEHPYFDSGDSNVNLDPNSGIKETSLADYLGVPTTGQAVSSWPIDHPMRNLNALPFAAYFKIYDDYYRDQNLHTEKFKPLVEGNNGTNYSDHTGEIFDAGSLLWRAWEKDYYTSCLPFAQKGQEVVLPLGDRADIKFDGDNTHRTRLRDMTDQLINSADASAPVMWSNTADSTFINDSGTDPSVNFDVSENHYVDLQNATSASINDLRMAVRLQEFFERNARLGTRYIEQMLGKFGVRISDARAHRSQLLGATSSLISFSEVLQTSQTDTTPLGQQAGHGMSINQEYLCNHYVEEHGFIMVIASVLPKTGYQQGLNKMWFKKDILDYYDPMFANLGEQEVKNWEVYAENISTYNDTFGYQSRYAELKYSQNRVSGLMRSTHSDWHMNRIFDSPPALNGDFVNSNPTHRIYADTDPNAQKLFCWFHFNDDSQRKIPFFSTPMLSGIGK